MQVHKGSPISNGQNTTGKGALLDELVDHTVHLVHASRPKSHILRGSRAQGHGAPRNLEALTVGMILGESHRQSAPNIDLAEERGDRRPAARLREPEGTEVGRDLGKLGQEIGAAEAGDDHGHIGFRQPFQEPDQALGDRLPIERGRYQDVGEILHAFQDLVRPLLQDLVAQQNGLDVDPPSSELTSREAGIIRHDDMQDPERLFGREW